MAKNTIRKCIRAKHTCSKANAALPKLKDQLRKPCASKTAPTSLSPTPPKTFPPIKPLTATPTASPTPSTVPPSLEPSIAGGTAYAPNQNKERNEPSKPQVPPTLHSLDTTFDTYSKVHCGELGADLLGYVARQMGASQFKCLASWSQVTETQVLFIVGMFDDAATAAPSQLQVCRVRNISTAVNEIRFGEPELEDLKLDPHSPGAPFEVALELDDAAKLEGSKLGWGALRLGKLRRYKAKLVEPPAVANEYALDYCRRLFDPSAAALLQPHVDAVNSNSSLGWSAALYPRFALQDLETTRRAQLGYAPSALLATLPEPRPLSAAEMLQLPRSYDHRVAMRADGIDCKTWSVGEQKSCGGCWAFASARAYNERMCRATRGRVNVEISEQDMISCYASGTFSYSWAAGKQQITGKYGNWTSADGCGGGSPVNALLSMVDSGRVSRWADPYHAVGSAAQPCGRYELDNSLKYGLAAGSVWRITSGDVALIQAQISSGGPVVAAMMVYQDLLAYESGVYVRSSDAFVGNHLVALIGWGYASSADGKRYWVFANSWGADWGEGGYGRIQHGQAAIESEIVYPSVTEPQRCAASAGCKNGGEFTDDCGCHCEGLWSGADCGSCARTCENGGAMRQDSCSCSCTAGYFGATCGEYWLAQWESSNGDDATIRFSWSVSAVNAGSKFVRYAKALGSSDNPIVTGYDVPIAASSGQQTKTINLNSRLPKPYPEDMWAYAVHIAQGKNEFGHDLGYKVSDLPALVYNRSAGCLSGGHKPGTSSTAKLCAGAYPDVLQPAGTAAPVERPTAYPTSLDTPAPVECRPAGAPYRGSLAMTEGGTACASWAGRSGYAENNDQGAHCRATADSAGRLWCFTTALPASTWGYCRSLPECEAAPPAAPPATDAPSRGPTHARTAPPTEGLPSTASPTADCRTAGSPYEGRKATTDRGFACKSWAGRGYTSVAQQGSVCRETPDSAGRIWCFTAALPGDTWDYCSVPDCT